MACESGFWDSVNPIRFYTKLTEMRTSPLMWVFGGGEMGQQVIDTKKAMIVGDGHVQIIVSGWHSSRARVCSQTIGKSRVSVSVANVTPTCVDR